MHIALYGTPLSHFTRKIRILLKELGIAFEWVRPASVLCDDVAAYGGNPLMRIPTLVHGPDTVLDSDHIARFVVSRYDASDRLGVLTCDPQELNRLAVIHGIMANEVVLILAKRGGVEDVAAIAYFRKLYSAVESGLRWLEAATPPGSGAFRYPEIAAVCMWQHLEHYGLVPDLHRYPRLAEHVARFAARASVAATTPAASLEEARKAGWVSA